MAHARGTDARAGTHCAGTVAARSNNSVGVAGTAWGIKLAACKFMTASGSGSTSNAITCLSTLRQAGVLITSNSAPLLS